MDFKFLAFVVFLFGIVGTFYVYYNDADSFNPSNTYEVNENITNYDKFDEYKALSTEYGNSDILVLKLFFGAITTLIVFSILIYLRRG